MKSQGTQYRTMFHEAGMAWGKGTLHKALATAHG